jgi:hypothetical protein
MTEHEAMTTLVKLLQGNAVRERFDRIYSGVDDDAEEINCIACGDGWTADGETPCIVCGGAENNYVDKTVCVGCGGGEADFVCTSANHHVKEIEADAIQRGYTRDEAEKIWMIVRGPHCWPCYSVANVPPKKELGQ